METQTSGTLLGKPVLSIRVRGPWGHFRRIEGNIVKQTYRIIPRTTVAGLLAGIVGLDRDRYYEIFAEGRSAVATELASEIRTLNMPQNNLSTNPEAIKTAKSGQSASIGLVDPTQLRQQFNYQVLVDPAYRIDVWTEDDHFFDRLEQALENGLSHYVPSLGLSEHLAEIEYLGKHTIEDGPSAPPVEIDSTVVGALNDVVPRVDTSIERERSPAFMETVPPDEGGGRRTTGYVTYAYDPSGGPLEVDASETYTVDDRTVMFS